MSDPALWSAIALGGAIGAMGRAGCLRGAAWLGTFAGSGATGLAATAGGTLVANLLACFALGWVSAHSSELPHGLSMLLGVGLCGALSTFSTLCADFFRLARSPRGRWSAVLYLVASFGLGFLALGAGGALGS